MAGVSISGQIKPKSNFDSYQTHLDNLGKGGVHTKPDIASMNSITTERRSRMMLCVVADIGTGVPGLYWLNTPPNPTKLQLADNQYWQPVPLGTQIDGVLTLLGFQNASGLTIVDGTGSTGDTYIVDVGGNVNNPNIFGGQSKTLTVGDYLVYENNIWNLVQTGANSVTWNTLTGKPTTFNPSPHQHVIADITDFPDLSGYVLSSDILTSIPSSGSNLKLANIEAIRLYVSDKVANVDLSNYYNKVETDNKINDALQLASEGIIGEVADIAARNALTGGDTINGFVLSSGDRILATENFIKKVYQFTGNTGDTGAAFWTYVYDFSQGIGTGLTLNSGVIELGGILTKHLTFTGANIIDVTFGTVSNPIRDFYINAAWGFQFVEGNGGALQLSPNGFRLIGAGSGTYIDLDGILNYDPFYDLLKLGSSDELSIDTVNNRITTSVDLRGTTDLSGGYVGNSFVQKSWVETQIAASSGGSSRSVTKTTDPTVNNDLNDTVDSPDGVGFQVNDLWGNSTSEEVFRAFSVADGAAKWLKTTLTIDELATVAATGDYNDLTNKPTNLVTTDAQPIIIVTASAGTVTLDMNNERDKYFRILNAGGSDADFTIAFANAPTDGAYAVLEVVRTDNITRNITFPTGSNLVNSDQNLDNGSTALSVEGTDAASGKIRMHYLGILFTKPSTNNKYIINVSSTRSFIP